MFEIDEPPHPSTAASERPTNDHVLADDGTEDATYLFDSTGDLLGDALIGADVGDDTTTTPSEFHVLRGAGPPDDGGDTSFANFDDMGLYDQYETAGAADLHFGEADAKSDGGESHMSSQDEIIVGPAGFLNGWRDGAFDKGHEGGATAQSTATTGSGSLEVASPLPINGHVEIPSPLPHALPTTTVAEESLLGTSTSHQSESLFDPIEATTARDALDGPLPPALQPPSKPFTPDPIIQIPSFESTPQSSAVSPVKKIDMPRVKEEHESLRASQPVQSSTRGRPPKKAGPEYRAKSSIPTNMHPEDYAHECMMAAISSRLNPHALHPGEHKMLREHVTHPQVTNYLNIRNAILRLWVKNSLNSVSKNEAAGCAKESRYINTALVAHQWLVRNGYINFGCVEVPSTVGPIPRLKDKRRRQKTIVVIGAGMSGLGCARHLESLVAQLGKYWTKESEKPPRVIVLEGRRRVGGRVYSIPLADQSKSNLPNNSRSTAEMGAQIVTGFEQGNPMNALIRGQLGIHYHVLRDMSVLYDIDGQLVDKTRDTMIERLYNDVLERAAIYRTKQDPVSTVEGSRELMERGKDSSAETGDFIAALEDAGLPVAQPRGRFKTKQPTSVVENAPALSEKLGGRAYQTTGSSTEPAAKSAMEMGWQLKPHITPEHTIDLEPIARSSPHVTLGETMDEGIRQCQELLDLTPQDLRLLNWHHANLEYANAANVNKLSLGLWDQDIGNEFDGPHCTIVGGYQQVPQSLYFHPSKLDVRFQKTIRAIRYHEDGMDDNPTASVECEDGEVFEADRVVMTASLGVLKDGSVAFEPPLPDWKQGAIDRLGFGVLNKVYNFTSSIITPANLEGHPHLRPRLLGA
jgi:hypothetical protein